MAGNDNPVTNNSITRSDDAAVAIQGNDNAVRANIITDALIGILTASGSSGNTITGNTFFDTVTETEDPITSFVGLAGPAR